MSLTKLKTIIASLSALLILLAPGVVAATTPRHWTVQIFDPAASVSGDSLNVEFNVLSTVETDNFTVRLFQNGNQAGNEQTITTDFGDSGVFEVNFPANGTYSYYVEAINSGDGSTKSSDTVTVQVNGAQVTTIDQQATNANGATNGAQDGSSTDVSATGEVSSSSTDGQDDVLGAGDSNNSAWYIGVPLALVALGAVFYWLRTKQGLDS